MSNTKITKDHKLIKEWVVARGGVPGRVAESELPTDEEGALDIKFPEKTEKNIIPITWNEFFIKFEQSNLAFLIEEDRGDGLKSKFFKLISSDGE
jgi:hypothetical protein